MDGVKKKAKPPEIDPALRSAPAFAGLSAKAKADIAEIIRLAKRRPDGADFVDKIRVILETPYVPTSVEDQNRAELNASVAAAQLSTSDHFSEEKASADPSRQWTELTPRGGIAPWLVEQGKTVPHLDVDRSDPANIVVRVRVHLSGALAADVAKLEDAIEKHVNHPGFTVDLQLVDAPGPDVYEVTTDPTLWPVASNWASGSDTLGHELMHLLGLDDEYDYREHASNSAMTMDDRLHWLRVQAGRPAAPDDAWQGIMTSSSNAVLDRQVREVAQLPEQTDEDKARAEALRSRLRLAVVVP